MASGSHIRKVRKMDNKATVDNYEVCQGLLTSDWLIYLAGDLDRKAVRAMHKCGEQVASMSYHQLEGEEAVVFAV